MRTLHVELGDRSYPIYIGTDLLGTELLARHLNPGARALLISNETVAPLFRGRIATPPETAISDLILPDGERYKTLATCEEVYDRLISERFDRSSTLIALGGGVIGDLTGFCAATYQRGIDFIQIPTTLLAQVDSSVGGKTGVNHPRGKNMIGAFHQPRAVIADMGLLTDLPARELAAGLAEVIKYGLIRDPAFFAWLEQHIEALIARDTEALAHAVAESCRNKAEVVAADEREAGERALLNLGHTFGHAIETETGYSSWLHGEAVAVGLRLAARLSVDLGWLEASDLERLEALLDRCGLPLHPPAIAPERFLELMSVDKKNRGGALRLVLLHGIGKAIVTSDVPPATLEQMLHAEYAR
ncbi:3-dehydroquinate synthase [Halorhodospira abdelmalekii]|uniref:3-dehydroquinate synthase n=1 Tax=Halorhodospira abdelmalekii TaxID=421629 RepID=UPI0019031D68|nr:3-dehydroquinate synthase [Halorhodospira abdelmalekii]MBK1734740.1 3-dehydroquinate synthase [Halorhodospira abdelmalekii]